MRKRLTDRYDVASVRHRRGDPKRFIEALRTILPGGSVFHVLAYTPEQAEDLFCVLVDGHTVVSFELPRSDGAEPVEVAISSYEAYRRAIGQGRHRIFLDRAAEDARTVLSVEESESRTSPEEGTNG